MSRLLPAPALVLASALAGHARCVITEIHYHPVEEPAFLADGSPELDLTDDVHEFIELQNTGVTALDTGNWRLTGGVNFTFPPGSTIAPGEFVVIAKNPGRVEIVYGLTPGSLLGPFTGKLGNSGDTVTIRNAAGEVIDEVTYSAGFPWAISANAFGAQDRFTGLNSAAFNYRGRSLQRVSVSARSNDPANWLASPISGPTPGGPQAVTRAVPKPVVVAQSRSQAADGAAVIRSGQPVTVRAAFSDTTGLTDVQVEYFTDDVNSTAELRAAVPMTALGGGGFVATLPPQGDRSIVRYRIRADRGEGLESVSPRDDDPQMAPVGPGGALEAWHGYFVTPPRTSVNPVYDVLAGSAQLSRMGTNISANPRRVTVAGATGLPREVPWVAATAPLWNGTVPAVFACNGEIRDIQLRYHGSRYHRATTNQSFKIHFPESEPFRGVTSFFITGHTANTAETQKMYRLLDLPSSLTRTVDWYFNGNSMLSRLEHGEYEKHVLEEWTARQQQLHPGSPREETGEFYKAIGNIDPSQNNTEGPFTKADQAPMLANIGWTRLQRYEWTYSLQNNAWKGHLPLQDMIEGMWAARGDTPQLPSLAGNPASLASAKAWFQANFDIEATLTAMAVCQWTGIWDDTGHNQFFWRRADGRWVRLPWDFDDTMTAGRASQSIYSNESGVSTFNGPNWWKDTFFKCFRDEFKQRLWHLNNSFFDPANLSANGLTTAASFAATRQGNVNGQTALGSYTKPARPVNSQPAAGSGIVGGAALTASAYSHPSGRPHSASKWEIRTAAGDFEEPEVRTVTTGLTSLPVPFDQLTYGQTYYWRVTYTDADGHSSVVSAETAFSYGTASTSAGTLVLNEILADNQGAVEHAGTTPDFIELRNNGTATAALSGLSLTDDPLLPARYVFPAGTTLAAGASLVIWCDDATSAPGLHSGFGLNAGGQTVLLLNGGAILDAVTFGPQAPDISIGRIVNGTGGWQANQPTPGSANTAMALGSSSALRINEWMAAPAYGDDWLELCNTGTAPVALGGLWLSDDPAAPARTPIPPLSFIAGRSFTKFIADGSTSGGHHLNFKLSGGGDNVVLTAVDGLTTLQSITFGARPSDTSGGRLPDGSDTITDFPDTASPGRSNWLPATVVISEVLANSSPPFTDMVEIHNPGPAAADIGNWWLSDDPSALRKFHIPPGTVIASGGFMVFTGEQFAAAAAPFQISSFGDEVILSAVDSGDVLTGSRAQVSFGASAPNVSFGRIETASGPEFWPLTAVTAGGANAAAKTEPVIISEIHYHPPDAAGGTDSSTGEFIELHNPGGSPVDMTGWRLRGDADFTFPAGSSMDGGAYWILTEFPPDDAAALDAFRTEYGLPPDISIFGPYSPKLPNGTGRIELVWASLPTGTDTPWIRADRVEYRDTAPWDPAADGTGFSLQRESRAVIGNDAANWTAAAPTPGSINREVVGELTIFSSAPLPGGVTGTAYSHTLSAAGGQPPYQWTLSSGSLPPGLTLAADGTVGGTPAAAGTAAFSVQLTDAAGASAARSLTLTIADSAVTVTTAVLPDGVSGTPYQQTLTAAGGNAGYTWSLAGGALPGGLSLSGAGVISGIPNESGTFGFFVRVTDAGSLAAARSLSIFIPVPPLAILTAAGLPAATEGEVYSQALLGAGGIPPYTWTVAGGTLPDGLALSPAGELRGVPSVTGTFSFTAGLTDAAASGISRSFSLAVNPAPLLITSDSSLPDGIAGDAYAFQITAAGGTLPRSWTLLTGELPAGMTLTPSGILTGTPESAGLFPFAAGVSDGGGQSATRSFSLDVAASGPPDHFSWDYVPGAAAAGVPFAVRLTARDSRERLVTSFSENVSVSAASGSGALPSPVVITEVCNEVEDQFELQNVSGAPVSTAGWFVRLGDSTTSISQLNATAFSLPAAMAPGSIIRVSEQNVADRSFFGAPINWNTTTPRGWVLLFDGAGTVRDCFIFGWTGTQIAQMSLLVNSRTITAAGNWSGAGSAQGILGNITNNTDSWQRAGTADSNSAADWQWQLTAQSLGSTNAGLALPWTSALPVPSHPSAVTFAGGEWTGYLTAGQPAPTVKLTATAAAVTGTSRAFDVAATPLDSEGDGLPDEFEFAHGLDPYTFDAALDTDQDGASNLTEFHFGTNPALAASVPVISLVKVTPAGDLVLSWPGSAGKLYRIATGTDLLTWSYTPALATASGMQSATIPATTGNFFVRVEITPAP